MFRIAAIALVGLTLTAPPLHAAEDPSGTIIRLHCTQVLRSPPQDVATNNPDPDEHDLWVKALLSKIAGISSRPSDA